jgi:single-strand DNA-binding protein
MNDLNAVSIIGRITKDIEIKYTAGGTSIASFSIATNRKYKEKQEVFFTDCVAFGKPGEIIAQYTKKGDRIALNGRLSQNSWEDKDGNTRRSIQIIVSDFQFLTTKEK